MIDPCFLVLAVLAMMQSLWINQQDYLLISLSTTIAARPVIRIPPIVNAATGFTVRFNGVGPDVLPETSSYAPQPSSHGDPIGYSGGQVAVCALIGCLLTFVFTCALVTSPLWLSSEENPYLGPRDLAVLEGDSNIKAIMRSIGTQSEGIQTERPVYASTGTQHDGGSDKEIEELEIRVREMGQTLDDLYKNILAEEERYRKSRVAQTAILKHMNEEIEKLQKLIDTPKSNTNHSTDENKDKCIVVLKAVAAGLSSNIDEKAGYIADVQQLIDEIVNESNVKDERIAELQKLVDKLPNTSDTEDERIAKLEALMEIYDLYYRREDFQKSEEAFGELKRRCSEQLDYIKHLEDESKGLKSRLEKLEDED